MNEPTAQPVTSGEAKGVLEEVLKLMGFEAKVEAFDQPEGEILLHIDTADAGRLIGRGAQVLDALQTVLHRMLAKQHGQGVRCIVDVERYRERQKDRLLQMAHEAADRVRADGEPVRLPSMNAADRRIVHQALKDDADVTTHSEEIGDEGEKRVVVTRKSGSPEQPPATPSA